MAPTKKSGGPKGRQVGNSPGRGTPARRRLTGRKIVALGILIVLPLAVIAGVIGSIGSSSNQTGSDSAASGAPPGLDLMTQACTQLSTLAENAGAVSATTTTTKPATPTATAGGTTTTTDNSAAASNLLAGMAQVAQLAANAAGTNSAWQPMASDIGKLNDMLQSDTGDDTSFSSQLDTVGQECSAVVGSTTSPPGTSP
jgi:hypothetical protein